MCRQAAKVPLVIAGAGPKTTDVPRSPTHDETIKRLGADRDNRFQATHAPEGSVQMVLDEATLAMPLKGVIDIGAESERLKREIDKVGYRDQAQLAERLSNDKFVSRAPAHIVEEQRERKVRSRGRGGQIGACSEAPRSRAIRRHLDHALIDYRCNHAGQTLPRILALCC